MKRKNEKSDNIWDKIINTLWYLLFGFIFGMLVLISVSIKGHCAGNENDSYFPMGQNDNNLFPAEVISYIENTYGEDYYVFGKFYNESTSYLRYFIYLVEKNNPDLVSPVFAEIYNNGYQFSLYFIGNYSFTIRRLEFYKSNLTIRNDSTGYTSPYNDLNSSLYDVNCSYISNYRIYTSNNTDNRSVVLNYGSDEPIIDYGHASPPEEFHNPFFNPNSHAQPPEEVPPQVIINNYTWNTYNPPAIDDTDIISTLKSLIYVVNYLMGWLKDNISGELQNLLSNLSAFFDYIGQTIQYYGGLIIDNIQNLITTFYNNMVSIGENIAEKVGYISEPFNSSALIDAFEDMQIYDDYDRCGQLIDDAFGFFDDISEPQSFTIPIDLRGITLLHQTQILYLDLGWINSAKSVIRAFMWTVTTFGLLYTVIDSIPDYIQGQDE